MVHHWSRTPLKYILKSVPTLLQGASQVYLCYSYPSFNKIGLSEILTSSNWQLSIVPKTVIFIGKLEAHCWLSSRIKKCCLQKWNSVSNTFTFEAPDRRQTFQKCQKFKDFTASGTQLGRTQEKYNKKQHQLITHKWGIKTADLMASDGGLETNIHHVMLMRDGFVQVSSAEGGKTPAPWPRLPML